MQNSRMTFMVVPADAGSVREFRIGKYVLYLCLAIVLSGTMSLIFFTYGYFQKTGQEKLTELLLAEQKRLENDLHSKDLQVAEIEKVLGRLIENDERLRDYHMMESVSEEMRRGGIGGTEGNTDVSQIGNHPPQLSVGRNIHGITAKLQRLHQMALFQEQSFAKIEREFLVSEGDLRHFPTIWPVAKNRTWISSGFGFRTDPFTGAKARHLGIDFAGRLRTPVVATGDGVVTHAYEDRRLGNIVVIEHSVEEKNSDGVPFLRRGMFRTEYGHLDEYVVKIGQRVRRNQEIGFLGNTGRSTGPHLHYSVRYIDRNKGGTKGYVDPKDFLLDYVQRDTNARARGWSQE
ncbi:MAG: M23 family metallopeptidase [Candidatus Latescibacterota bacterium]|nr:M23 family metallopeptidase [Candidatus Latescibacterota bacterium]